MKIYVQIVMSQKCVPMAHLALQYQYQITQAAATVICLAPVSRTNMTYCWCALKQEKWPYLPTVEARLQKLIAYQQLFLIWDLWK